MTRCVIVAGLAVTLSLAWLGGCSKNMTVTRTDPENVVDLDYRFNADDAREVYKATVDDALFRKWIDNWMGSHGGAKPIVVIGPIKNDTQDYIVTANFTEEWQRELLNSERVRFVASKEDRPDIREERQQGQDWNTPETRKQMRAETGADLILLGRVTDDKQKSLDGKQIVAQYRVGLQLWNIESNELLWSGSKEIKKLARIN
ncbi:MAG: hypothetical protein KF745_15330 [Phycisphaeraceae bacterium]|nr:hypothetical protein [Phycisphaeraceae bacterium]